jgi:hypothetical protein
MHDTIPVRILKRTEISSPLRSPSGAPIANPGKTCPAIVEPKVQFVERSPGVYDILFTCRCGETSLIRCESLQ